ncbi:MAG: F0F1 ATP synthase subunit B [Ferrovum sp. 37-45-19]|uniref:F0F1 ATP synthase subunit B n=1 Tax=Ferrovum sp. JA12 TaxID=1356299 RepID=UPI0007034FF5|nr:F0F1 ATP synthase subunit B [Ferrovum sp. JA12]OYV79380.1 MAG: F0F1 ATP synthase subunit B [Ferrovum sp. 21-44-67]OYV93981.1 MAG: F0F1 ATP synthase subunit B [Ferrovum sp. 37-45-19]HQT81815.1 F0F1 ATP synthase subunit B [Ferrovaceae bacterium]KRH79384.1 ATP synthase subunit b [Ferrovum sp. JA12]HQU06768.1 F0F1 ATP synthase subunit B [Ferrovaceae bacterium]
MNINATLLGQAITFAILIWVTMKFIWPPITVALDERAKKIADGLAAAERAKSDLATAETKSQEALKEAKEKAAEIISLSEKRRNEIIEEAKNEARAEAERVLVQAKAEVAQEMNKAKEELRAQVADLAMAGAEKILRREINPAVHAELLSSIRAEL